MSGRARQESDKALGEGAAAAYNRRMADFLALVLVFAFFGLCVAFVYGCDKIIGPDDEADLDDVADEGRAYTEIESVEREVTP